MLGVTVRNRQCKPLGSVPGQKVGAQQMPATMSITKTLLLLLCLRCLYNSPLWSLLPGTPCLQAFSLCFPSLLSQNYLVTAHRLSNVREAEPRLNPNVTTNRPFSILGAHLPHRKTKGVTGLSRFPHTAVCGTRTCQ